jgi:DNA primase small subunit
MKGPKGEGVPRLHEIVINEFKDYYKNLDKNALSVLDLQHRELAFLQFGQNIMIRHTSYANEQELKEDLMEKPPAHLYYSSAYYSKPAELNMNEKGWNGADLVFDIDADHIPTKCKVDHDKWKCLDCNNEGKGFPPDKCDKCGKKRIETSTWVCDTCLNVTKKEIFKLIEEYLTTDFGLSLKDMEICYSGHRGYHLHIINEDFKTLNNDGRREIADYVRGIGLELERHGFTRIGARDPLIGPDLKDKGWRGRFVKSFYSYLNDCEPSKLAEIIDSKVVAKRICLNKERIQKKIEESNSWWATLAFKEDDVLRFSKILMESIKDITCNIDERVTIDTKRLIRYPNSLHGKSGLRANKITYADLESFDPLRDAVVFKEGSIKVYVRDVPRIRIGDAEIGPLNDAKVEVPMALGIYMICRGAAEPLK